MMMRRRFLFATAVVALGICGTLLPFGAGAAENLPSRLSDEQFWKIVTEFSEPNGYFRSDNLLSNESGFQYVIPELIQTAKPGRVYMGVGPEQNFTYIAAVRPAMVFIVDVRQGNRDLQLMYKALFELSADRAEFVSRLFSRKRPAGLSAESTAAELFGAYARVQTETSLVDENLKAIQDHLTTTHGFSLSGDDLKGIAYVYSAFVSYGPDLVYSSTGSFGGGFQPSYAELMTATDGAGRARGYLASEESFAFLKDLESRNMLVPIVGNFGGPKAIRAVADYLKQRDATVSAFYLSNVEQYLRQDGIWRDFCGNVAALPLDETSTFIRSLRGGRFGGGGSLGSELGQMAVEVKDCK
jgi:hypothetical protein